MKSQKNRHPFLFALALTATWLLILSAGPVTAQTHVSASAEASIVEGIAIRKVSDLEFGSMIATAEGGTVTIDAGSGEVSSDGVRHVHNSNCRTAQFTTTGEAHYTYTIALPMTVKLEHEKGKGSMVVTGLEYSDGAGAINEKGEQSFGIGATLHVGPNQATGRYLGTFEISIQHQ